MATTEPKKNASKGKNKKDQRTYTRFPGEPMSTAQIDGEAGSSAFNPKTSGLILNESFRGCALVTINSELFPGNFCRVKLGRLKPLKAEVRWRTDLDGAVSILGIMFLE